MVLTSERSSSQVDFVFHQFVFQQKDEIKHALVHLQSFSVLRKSPTKWEVGTHQVLNYAGMQDG